MKSALYLEVVHSPWDSAAEEADLDLVGLLPPMAEQLGGWRYAGPGGGGVTYTVTIVSY